MSPAEVLQLAEQLAQALQTVTPSAQLPTLNAVRRLLHAVSPLGQSPVDLVQWVPVGQVEGNTYNPNAVARREMTLLARSVAHDGYTQPIVTIYDHARHVYTIVDGFHRAALMHADHALAAQHHHALPVVVLDKSLAERMAATVRHNRARGKHSVDGMANLVFQMLDMGMDDAAVCTELGMEPDELIRLKHITGFSKLFEDHAYSRAWTTRAQVLLQQARQARGTLPTPPATPAPEGE